MALLIDGGAELNPGPMEFMVERREGRGIHEWLKNNKSILDTMSVKVDHMY